MALPRRIRFLALAILLATFTFMHTTDAQDYHFTEFTVPGADDTLIHGINDQGIVVGEYGRINFANPFLGASHGFIYDGVEIRTIDVPGAVSTTALAINNHGHVVGEYLSQDRKPRGFLFDGQTFHDILTPYAVGASASGINDDGTIVGSYSSDLFEADIHGFTFDGVNYTAFDFPRADRTFLTGLNNANQRVGSTFDLAAGGAFGFLLPDFISIAHPDALTTDVRAISNSGLVVGTQTVMVDLLEFRQGGFSYDIATEAFADIALPGIVCSFTLDLDPSSVPTECLRSLRGVNSSGNIVGYFDNNDGVFRGFVGVLDEPNLLGDFNADKTLDAQDIDSLSKAIREGSSDLTFDVDADTTISAADRVHWVKTLRRTYFGDSNFDGEFNSGDLIVVLTAGHYEDNFVGNSGWSTGDWDGDGDFTTADLVTALADGGYEGGPQAATLAVPEPTSSFAWIIAAAVLAGLRRQERPHAENNRLSQAVMAAEGLPPGTWATTNPHLSRTAH